jgi:ABC-type amino acid transport substrate-binding protein
MIKLIKCSINRNVSVAMFISLILLITVNLSSQSKDINLTAEESKWLEEHPVIKVSNEMDWTPFNFNRNGIPQGFSIDYITLLAETIGFEIDFISGPSWNDFMEMIQNKELDIILNIAYSEERAEFIKFTDPYFEFAPGLYTRKDYPTINSVEDLYGKKFAVPKGFFFEDYFKDHPQVELVRVLDTKEALLAVSNGRADAMLDLMPVTNFFINQLLITNLHANGTLGMGEGEPIAAHLGIRDDWPLLHSAIIKAMAQVSPAQMNELRQKWLTAARVERLVQAEDIRDDQIELFQFIIIAGIVSLFFSIGFWLILRLHKKKDFALNFGSKQFRWFTLTGLSLILAAITILALLFLDRNRRVTLDATEKTLTVILENAEVRLHNWISQRTSYLESLSRDPELIALTEELLTIEPDQDSQVLSSAQRRIRKYFENKNEDFPTLGFFIINSDFISIGSKRDANIGIRNLISEEHPDLLERAFSGEVLFVPPMQSDVPLKEVTGQNTEKNPPTMFFLGPIQKPDGSIIAVMTLRIDPSDKFSESMQFSTTKSTSDTYAVNLEGLLLSESRFNEDLHEIGLLEKNLFSALNIELLDPGVNMVKGIQPPLERSEQSLTIMVERVIQMSTAIGKGNLQASHPEIITEMDGYRDYRGVDVFGGGIWAPNLGFGLISEVDVDDALSQYYSLRITIFIILIITILLTSSAVLIVLMLGEKANKELIKARDNLEEIVAERTEELSREIQEKATTEKVLKNKLEELELFNMLTIGRELKMIDLKKEINEMRIQSGHTKKYEIVKENDQIISQ